MSDYDTAKDWATGSGDDDDTIEHTFEHNGTEIEIELKPVTERELEALDDELAEDELEATNEAIDEYLVRLGDWEDVDPTEMRMDRKSLLFVEMQQAWSGMDDIQAAMEEMPIEGNRRQR